MAIFLSAWLSSHQTVLKMPHFFQAHQAQKGQTGDLLLRDAQRTHWEPGNLLSREPRHKEILHTKLFSYYKLLLLLCACVTTGHVHITDTNCSSAQLRGWHNRVNSKDKLSSGITWFVQGYKWSWQQNQGVLSFFHVPAVSALRCLAGYCNSAEHLLLWLSELLLAKLCSGQSTLPQSSLANLNLAK